MYTRCTACHTVHPVNADLLARSGGKFRCGKCKKAGNALDALFDEWPEAGVKPAATGEVPVLGLPIDLDAARESRLTPDEAGLYGDADADPRPPEGPGKILLRLSWITMALVIVAVIAFKLLEFHEKPLPGLPVMDSLMTRLGIQSPPAAPPFRDLEQIQLVSRELASHPVRSDMLRLTATIVNKAPQSQPYPDLELIMLDAEGRPIGNFRFSPADYLTEGASRDAGMTSQAFLPLTLDLPDPGSAAVGFELNFH